MSRFLSLDRCQLHVSFCGGRIGRGLGSRLPGEALALASHPDHHLDRERTHRIRGGERDSFSEALVHDHVNKLSDDVKRQLAAIADAELTSVDLLADIIDAHRKR